MNEENLANGEAPKSPGQDDYVNSTEAGRQLTRFGYTESEVERVRRWRRRREARDARRRSAAISIEREPVHPASFGMTAGEIRAEADRLRRMGWSDAEIRARLVDPRRVSV